MIDPLVIDVLYMAIMTNVLYLIILFFFIFAENRKDLHKYPSIETLPGVSILIPAFNEEKSIKETIDSVKNLDYPKDKLEIIVIDDCSKDKTYQIAKAQKGVKVLRNQTNSGKSFSVNRAIIAAKHDFVATLDADSFPEKDSLRKSVKMFTTPNVAAVTASVFARESRSFLARLQRVEYIAIPATRKLLQYVGSIYALPGPLTVYRKDALLKVGGFDRKNMTEDIEMAFRLLSHGYDLKMSLDSHIYTKVPETFKQWWKQRVRWNMGGMQTFMKYKRFMLNPKYGMLGLFLVPMFGISYLISFLSLSLSAYLIGRWLHDNSLFAFNVLDAGVGVEGVVRTSQFFLNGNSLMFLALLAFVLSLTLFTISFREAGATLKTGKWYFDLPIYLFVYVSVFPFTLMHAVYRLVRGRMQWM